jgi:hypothetical protein
MSAPKSGALRASAPLERECNAARQPGESSSARTVARLPGRPNGACPGYVVDHIVPLKRGGADGPGNMQWQTAAEAKAKDRVE